jgi:O-acetyl-ADP-ribose deacetylase (regulator of RNase III)
VLHCKADAVVSPANSFGDMGGGLDKALDDFLVHGTLM